MPKRMLQSLTAFLPTPAFVMAKKRTPSLKAATTSPSTSPILFVGKIDSPEAEQLLTKMIEAMGVKRQDVSVVNAVADFTLDSALYSTAEKTKLVVALGMTAAKSLLKTDESLEALRGKIHSRDGTKLMVTHHPSDLLQNPAAKKDAWADLQLAMKELGWKK